MTDLKKKIPECAFSLHKPLQSGDVVTLILFALSGHIPDNQGLVWSLAVNTASDVTASD